MHDDLKDMLKRAEALGGEEQRLRLLPEAERLDAVERLVAAHGSTGLGVGYKVLSPASIEELLKRRLELEDASGIRWCLSMAVGRLGVGGVMKVLGECLHVRGSGLDGALYFLPQFGASDGAENDASYRDLVERYRAVKSQPATTRDRLLRHAQKRELEQLLKRLEGVTIGGIVPQESLPDVQRALHRLFSVEAEPFSTIRGEPSEREQVEWLRQVILEFLAGGSELYVVFSGLGAAGWVHLLVDGEGRWVRSLWEAMPDREVFFASADRRRVLAITEEEAFHGAYLGHVE